jgi:hypothetical protein
MGARRNDRVSKQCRISAEERHHVVVCVNQLVLVVGMPVQIRADEAWSPSGPLYVGSKIKFCHLSISDRRFMSIRRRRATWRYKIILSGKLESGIAPNHKVEGTQLEA